MPFEFEKDLRVTETNIPGLSVFDLPVHGDSRGWFKYNWQRQQMMALGLPDFGPVQNNISFNAKKGVTRGIHAEPWDKYISIAAGEISARGWTSGRVTRSARCIRRVWTRRRRSMCRVPWATVSRRCRMGPCTRIW